LWVVIAGIVGARLWFVLNDIGGGNTRFLDNPLSIVDISKGGLQGLHIYGGFLFGAVAVYVYCRLQKVDLLLLLDSVGPGLLIGQAFARPANFINQELYGPPTSLPWGITIPAGRRLAAWADLAEYPVDTTRFHPTFAYEMLLNVLAGGVLLWIARRYADRLRPGVAFALWLILAGVARNIVEFFRPDQPRIPGTPISYTRVVSLLMILGGVILVLIKYDRLRVPFWSNSRAEYRYAPKPEPDSGPATGGN
jgi:phosphatidylglycerol:prolipoprotein diacylglycerol transferase